MDRDVRLLRWAVGARLILAGQNVFPSSIEPAARSPPWLRADRDAAATASLTARNVDAERRQAQEQR